MARFEEKQVVIREIAERMNASKSIVITDYRGLNVEQVTELRRRLREAGVEYKVLKNTMVRFAAKEVGIDGLDSVLEGPTAVAFGISDAVAPAKILTEFAKGNDKLQIKAGVLDKKVISAANVQALADIPPREVLLSMVLRGMQGPISGMVNVLQGNIRNLVYVLAAIQEKKEA